MLCQTILFGVIASLVFQGELASASDAINGSLSTSAYTGSLVLTSYYPLKLNYTTSAVDPMNIIGLYADNDQEEEVYKDPLKWVQAPSDDGRVELPVDGLASGPYKIVLLANHGFERLAAPVLVDIGRTFPGSMQILATNPLQIKFTTSNPHERNWLGMWPASGGGPEYQVHESPPLVWKYIGQESGIATLPVDRLGRGLYKLFFLANDSYNWLSSPVEFLVGDTTGYNGSIRVCYEGSMCAPHGQFAFEYNTTTPHEKNWMGLYHEYGGGPEHEVKIGDALQWQYVPNNTGVVQFDTKILGFGGGYKVYFLEQDGYKWLAKPVSFFMHDPNVRFKLLARNIYTPWIREGDAFKFDFSHLLNEPGDERLSWSNNKVTDKWIKWNITEPVIRGYAQMPKNPKKGCWAKMAVRISNRLSERVIINIRVRPRDQTLVQELRVMSWNLWEGGTQVANYHSQQVRFLVAQDVDVVGLQESGGYHGQRLGRALDWHVWQGEDVSIISRYPFAEVYGNHTVGGSVRIALDGKRSQIKVWNVHLRNSSYGPYGFYFDNKTIAQVLEGEKTRATEIKGIVDAMKKDIDNSDQVPVFLLGDFSSPSHLDWVDTAKQEHCGVGSVPWPASKYPIEAGLKDSFREAYPDPAVHTGHTWSPIFLNHSGRLEPMDRIDFVYHKGAKLFVNSSAPIMDMTEKNRPVPSHKKNRWTSDHMAVLTHYLIKNETQV